MNKVAVLIRGISYIENFNHHGIHYVNVDFEKTKDNIQENIINPLREMYEVDIYIETYTSNKIEMVRNFYKPMHMGISPWHPNSVQNNLVLKGLREIQKNMFKYSHVVLLRFDTIFKENLKNMRVDFEKFNLPFKEQYDERFNQKRGHVMGDTIFIFPSRFLVSLIDAIQKSVTPKNMHFIFDDLTAMIGIENINYMVDGFWDSNTDKMENPIYKIIRQVDTKKFWNKFNIRKDLIPKIVRNMNNY